MNEHKCEATDYLRRHGHVRCDIAACNCGSWHHRFGLPERWQEIKDALAEAGHPLCNENGHIALRAFAALVAERDALRAAEMRLQEALTALLGIGPKPCGHQFDCICATDAARAELARLKNESGDSAAI